MNVNPELLFPLSHHSSATLNISDAATHPLDSAMPLSSTETSLTQNIGKRRYRHTPSQIAKELRVDETGKLWWINPKQGRRLNRPIETKDKDGYIRFIVPPGNYCGHVLAWVLYYGEWPAYGFDIDHINGIKTDNRKDNLRLVTRSQNMLNSHKSNSNSTSGFPGVSFRPDRNKWRAYIKIGYKQISGGNYNTKEEAILARIKLEAQYEHRSATSL